MWCSSDKDKPILAQGQNNKSNNRVVCSVTVFEMESLSRVQILDESVFHLCLWKNNESVSFLFAQFKLNNIYLPTPPAGCDPRSLLNWSTTVENNGDSGVRYPTDVRSAGFRSQHLLKVTVVLWLLSLEMDTVTWVQILDNPDGISHNTNTLAKGMNPLILLAQSAKAVEYADCFSAEG